MTLKLMKPEHYNKTKQVIKNKTGADQLNTGRKDRKKKKKKERKNGGLTGERKTN